MSSSLENYRNLHPKHKKIIFYVLFGVLIFAVGSVGIGYTENELILKNGHLKITGLYGEKLPVSDIQSIELTDTRPSLGKRIHGFSMGNHKKGFFRTNSGQKVKAIINSHARPWILIIKKSGERIYFSSSRPPNEKMYQEMKKTLPDGFSN